MLLTFVHSSLTNVVVSYTLSPGPSACISFWDYHLYSLRLQEFGEAVQVVVPHQMRSALEGWEEARPVYQGQWLRFGGRKPVHTRDI